MIDQMTKQTETAFNTFKAAFAPFADAFKNVQTADVPEAARDFVKRAIDTAKERAADAHAGAEKVTAVIEDAAVGAVSETVKLSRNVQQAFYEDAEAFFTGIDKLASALRDTLKDPVVRERFASINTPLVGSTPDEFAVFLDKERKAAKELIERARIRID